ncbi:TPA: plasmid recombination protein [Burkholderia vietnamiensis]|nr:plasmid recombination protein [Burkholderia vietnamiensis]
MGYAILRTQKLKSGAGVRRSLVHAFRERQTPNADASRTSDNTHVGAASVDQALDAFNARLATQAKVRSNAVLAIEYLVTCSPEDMAAKSREQQDAYFADALDWLKAKHGAENVVYAGIHRDETTPHMYAYVTPIDERGKLNCRAFLGGSKALSTMQTEFAEQVGQKHQLARGVEKSRARHQTVRQWYSKVQSMADDPRLKLARYVAVPEAPGLLDRGDKRREMEEARKQAEAHNRKAAAHNKQREVLMRELAGRGLNSDAMRARSAQALDAERAAKAEAVKAESRMYGATAEALEARQELEKARHELEQAKAAQQALEARAEKLERTAKNLGRELATHAPERAREIQAQAAKTRATRAPAARDKGPSFER